MQLLEEGQGVQADQVGVVDLEVGDLREKNEYRIVKV